MFLLLSLYAIEEVQVVDTFAHGRSNARYIMLRKGFET